MLAEKLRNICFVHGLYSDKIQTVVRSRNHANFDEIAENTLEEESATVSKDERYRSSNVIFEGPKCSNCNKIGHTVSTCYLKDMRDARVNQLLVRNENQDKNRGITCYNCQGSEHSAKHFRKPKKQVERRHNKWKKWNQ